jgi:anti-anti-sigma regulatory factor
VKIEKDSHGGKIRIRLIGQFQLEDVEELKSQLQSESHEFVLDLKEVTIVDVDVVWFLATCKGDGVKIVNCSKYITKWIARERMIQH